MFTFARIRTAFALVLAWYIAPKLLAAKKWRNRVISPLLVAICLIPTLHTALLHGLLPVPGMRLLVVAAVLLFSLLMAFMGGRIIAPAAAGQLYRQGMHLAARVQPCLEAALILLLAGSTLVLFLPRGQLIAGPAAIAAGIIAAVRLARWRLWQCRARPDLLCLGIGYGWLTIGLCVLGAAIGLGTRVSPALHVITIGALGPLSTAVITRVHDQKRKRDPARSPVPVAAAALIALAVVMRVWAGMGPMQANALLWSAAAAWSLVYLLTGLGILRNLVWSGARPHHRRVKRESEP